jgi:hypothetical protein
MVIASLFIRNKLLSSDHPHILPLQCQLPPDQAITTGFEVAPTLFDACLDYGLQRIQYSAFFGDLSHTHAAVMPTHAGSMMGSKRRV